MEFPKLLLVHAGSSAAEANYNMGRINILNGKYSAAVSNYTDANSFNSSLAKLLNGNADAAMSAIEASKDKDSAMTTLVNSMGYSKFLEATPKQLAEAWAKKD